MIQLILHLWGDYLTQSDWMAQNKTKRWCPAIAHATVYSVPFFLIGSWQAVLVIWSTHAVIDRYRLARFVVWWKNIVLDPQGWVLRKSPAGVAFRIRYDWRNCSGTGYPCETHPWLAVWLMIIADNTLHLTINWLALRYL